MTMETESLIISAANAQHAMLIQWQKASTTVSMEIECRKIGLEAGLGIIG